MTTNVDQRTQPAIEAQLISFPEIQSFEWFDRLLTVASGALGQIDENPNNRFVRERCTTLLSGFHAELTNLHDLFQRDVPMALVRQPDAKRDSGTYSPVALAIFHLSNWLERRLRGVMTECESQMFPEIKEQVIGKSFSVDSQDLTAGEQRYLAKLRQAESFAELRKNLASGKLSDRHTSTQEAIETVINNPQNLSSPVFPLYHWLRILVEGNIIARNKTLELIIATCSPRIIGLINQNTEVAVDRVARGTKTYQITVAPAPITLATNKHDVLVVPLMVGERTYNLSVRFIREQRDQVLPTQDVFELVSVEATTRSETRALRKVNSTLTEKSPRLNDDTARTTFLEQMAMAIDNFNIAQENRITGKKVLATARQHRRAILAALVGALGIQALDLGLTVNAHRSEPLPAVASGNRTHRSTTMSLSSMDAGTASATNQHNASVADAGIPYLDSSLLEDVSEDHIVVAVPSPTLPTVAPPSLPSPAPTFGTRVDTFAVQHGYQANIQFAVQTMLRRNRSLTSGLSPEAVADYWASQRAKSPVSLDRIDDPVGPRHTNIGDQFTLYQDGSRGFNLVQVTRRGEQRVIHFNSVTEGKDAANTEARARRVRLRTIILENRSESEGQEVIASPSGETVPAVIPAEQAYASAYSLADELRRRTARSPQNPRHTLQKGGESTLYLEPGSTRYNHALNYQPKTERPQSRGRLQNLWHKVSNWFGGRRTAPKTRYADPSSAEYRAMTTTDRKVWVDSRAAHTIIHNLDEQRPSKTLRQRLSGFIASLWN
ncbi:MAG: hypothetical protein HY817_03320 [Candidatus Abawacabacteria bacterium]|nr:hypothetical protein [Candidatus Abawacabacteria bacterium]